MRNARLSQATAGDDGYSAGDLIAGKYRLGSTIREGSLCRVRMGIHTMLDLPVAIKFLRQEFRCPMLARLLQREARATAALQHPAVVRVLDWGMLAPDDGFIVMERLEGEDLREHLAREGTLPAEHAIRLLLPICSGVAAAHAHGIVHRDLKPENIVLAHDDADHLQPKVLDFGIANRAIGEKLQEGSGAAAVGTLGYMPPEQAFGIEGNDPRTDVWAFSAMMYEAASGRTPVLGDTLEEQRRALLEQEVPSLVELIGMDAALWAILERGLRKEPSERWPSMRELGQELARWLLSRGIHDDVCGRSMASEWLRPWPTAAWTPSTDWDDLSQPSDEASLRATPMPFPLTRTKSGRAARRERGYARARLDLVRSMQTELADSKDKRVP
jgi:serine/threonine-protein kinase